MKTICRNCKHLDKTKTTRQLCHVYPTCPAFQAEILQSLAYECYPEYLNTPYWQALAQQVKARDNWRCRTCGDNNRLEIHHITYEHLGYEPLTDLLTLCAPCHRLRHPEKQKPGPLIENNPEVRLKQELDKLKWTGNARDIWRKFNDK